jgi:GTP diphosphokinase / guanosine-3',5'-bis(diphosphate) 3'-diphosphatase
VPPAAGHPQVDAPNVRATDRSPTRRWRARLPWGGPDDPVEPLIRAHKRVHRGGDSAVIRRAYDTAERMHRGQMRKSGDPFITHPLAVAQILAELGMDTTTLVAALLHDTVEDTSYTLAELSTDFGAKVALLVDGVTKLDKAFFGDAAEVETVRKMLVKAGQDVRVLIIKVADRLHNMRTLDARSPASRARIARATLDVLVPLADRLGIQALKRSLDDTVLAALEPEAHADIAAHVANRPVFDRVVADTVAAVRHRLSGARIQAQVTARPRHYYSIWKDTIAAGAPLDHDLPRIAVVVAGSQTDCYTALGTLHAMWRPVPGRFKDFIASPKNNLYRSLHTTVIGPHGGEIEILIRTAQMHHAAEFGIAANFRDPVAAAALSTRARAEQLAWLRRVLDWQQSVDEPAKFLDALRCEISERQIQVFTADGRPVLLPVGATPVDLAYTLDADLGNACVSATINGRLAPLSSPLDEGDVVDIMTRDPRQAGDATVGPSTDWLDFVRSPQARLEITRWFSVRTEPVATVTHRIAVGRAAVGLALREQGRGLAGDGPLRELAARLGFPDADALLVAIADHRLTAADVVGQLVALVDRRNPDDPATAARPTGD